MRLILSLNFQQKENNTAVVLFEPDKSIWRVKKFKCSGSFLDLNRGLSDALSPPGPISI